MRHLKVQSSNVVSIACSTPGELPTALVDVVDVEVVFSSGKIYRYSDVPCRVFCAIAGAKSVGSAVAAHLVKTKHKFTIVEGPDPLMEQLKASVREDATGSGHK